PHCVSSHFALTTPGCVLASYINDSSPLAHFPLLNLAPFGVEHSIEKRITPVIPDHPILHKNALSPHSDLFQNPRRRDIFGIAPREDSMQAKLVKAERKKRLCDFGAISLAPEQSIEPEAEIGWTQKRVHGVQSRIEYSDPRATYHSTLLLVGHYE